MKNVWSQVQDQIAEQIWNQVRDQIDDRVRNQIRNRTWGLINNFDSQVGDSIRVFLANFRV